MWRRVLALVAGWLCGRGLWALVQWAYREVSMREAGLVFFGVVIGIGYCWLNAFGQRAFETWRDKER